VQTSANGGPEDRLNERQGDGGRPPWPHGQPGPFGPWAGPGRWHGGRRHGPQWARGPRTEGPLRRASEDRFAGGVAAGLAGRMGLDPTIVRLGLMIATLFTAGYAAVAYVAAWLLVPMTGTDTAIAPKAKADRRGLTVAAALGSLLVLILIGVTVLNVPFVGSLASPLILCIAGLVLVWRNAPAAERATLRDLAEPLESLTGRRGWTAIMVRAVTAVVLVAGGAAVFESTHRSLLLVHQLAGVTLVLAAVVVLFGPWWIRIARDLVTERQARIRAEERAEMASRVHDSVLQTLAMIQRRADQPQQVVQLARAQERELRAWLFDGQTPGSVDGQDRTVSGGVRQIQQEVEAAHGVPVEAVTVGDCELNDDLGALLAAAREATVNAAKWSGADVISLFAEVEPGEVSLYVRDRGRGFDPAAVPGDRKGLAESIRGRMARRGGSATVRSAPGQGTEVSLTMPRAGERQPSRG
jgi:signal transduction histidine kinase